MTAVAPTFRTGEVPKNKLFSPSRERSRVNLLRFPTAELLNSSENNGIFDRAAAPLVPDGLIFHAAGLPAGLDRRADCERLHSTQIWFEQKNASLI